MSIYFKDIQKRFDKASQTYDSVCEAQKKSAHYLVDEIITHKISPNTILDIGTGTGYTSEILMKHYPYAHYHLNDLSIDMLDVCQKKMKNMSQSISYWQGPANKLPLRFYDMVVSNFCFQWLPDWDMMIKKWASYSDMLAFSMLLKGTFEEWQNIINQYEKTQVIPCYPTDKDMMDTCHSMIESHDVFYVTHDIPIKRNHAKDFMLYLKKLGASSGKKTLTPSSLRHLLHDKQCIETHYKIMMVLLIRKK